MLQELLLNTVVQWLIFLFLPVIIFLVFFRNKTNFLTFLGLKMPEKVNVNLLVKTLIISFIFIIMGAFWPEKYNIGIDNIELLMFKQTGISIQLFLTIIIQSIIRTSFLEEIVFRGFLINSLRHKFSFNIANHIQAFIFTAIHILAMLNFSILDIVLGIISIYLLSIYFGKLMKESNYSIFYSSVFHGVLNILGAIMLILTN